MPESFLKEDLENFVLDVDDPHQVQQLAQRYGVSAQAMTIRLTNLLSLGRIWMEFMIRVGQTTGCCLA
jgi:Zn-dependent peptidase ImmA (M78 family)